MNKNLVASSNINIQSTPEKVWNVLTKPENIKEYLFGTEVLTDWKIGNPIVFQGEYNGQKYEDKGNVIENTKNKLPNTIIGVDFREWKANQKIILS